MSKSVVCWVEYDGIEVWSDEDTDFIKDEVAIEDRNDSDDEGFGVVNVEAESVFIERMSVKYETEAVLDDVEVGDFLLIVGWEYWVEGWAVEVSIWVVETVENSEVVEETEAGGRRIARAVFRWQVLTWPSYTK